MWGSTPACSPCPGASPGSGWVTAAGSARPGEEERCFVRGPQPAGGAAGRGAARLRGMNVASVRGHPAPRALPGRRGPPARQEALGVDWACGNDFIGKACDIFSPLVCGSWRRLEVYLVGTSGGSRAAAHIWTVPCYPAPLRAAQPLPRRPLGCPGLFNLCFCFSFYLFFFFSLWPPLDGASGFFFSSPGAAGQGEASGAGRLGSPLRSALPRVLPWVYFAFLPSLLSLVIRCSA